MFLCIVIITPTHKYILSLTRDERIDTACVCVRVPIQWFLSPSIGMCEQDKNDIGCVVGVIIMVDADVTKASHNCTPPSNIDTHMRTQTHTYTQVDIRQTLNSVLFTMNSDCVDTRCNDIADITDHTQKWTFSSRTRCTSHRFHFIRMVGAATASSWLSVNDANAPLMPLMHMIRTFCALLQ